MQPILACLDSMSFFDTYGPYDLERENGRVGGAQAAMWEQVPEDKADIGRAIGCYVFGIRYGSRIRPWYVGMTVARAGFRGEIFQRHKLDIYNLCLAKQRGSPVMFLFPLVKDGFYAFSEARRSKRREIAWLEIQLMGFAHRRNPDIGNVRDMTFLKSVQVTGVVGRRMPGRPFRDAAEARAMLIG